MRQESRLSNVDITEAIKDVDPEVIYGILDTYKLALAAREARRTCSLSRSGEGQDGHKLRRWYGDKTYRATEQVEKYEAVQRRLEGWQEQEGPLGALSKQFLDDVVLMRQALDHYLERA